MKILCLAFLLSASCAWGDDLFYADGEKTVIRTFTLDGSVLENVQIGERAADGRIEIYYKGGMTLVAERQLPSLWTRAIARREAQRLDPKKAAPVPATIEGAQAEEAYRKKMGECLMEATARLVYPVVLWDEKAGGGKFIGDLLARDASRLLITDGKAVAWVKDDYFKDGEKVRGWITMKNSPEVWLSARKAIEKKLWKIANDKWPDSPRMQAYTFDLEIEAWDRQHPEPTSSESIASQVIKSYSNDPFAEKPKKRR